MLSMNRPMKRSGSSSQHFRKRVPADVLTIARGKQCVVMLPPERSDGDQIHIKFTIGAGIRFSLRTRDPTVARQRNAAVTEQVERLFDELRAGPPPPRSLPPKQIVALAGEVYRLFAETLEDDQVLTADEWRKVERNQRDDLEWDVPVLRITSSPAEREAIRLAACSGVSVAATASQVLLRGCRTVFRGSARGTIARFVGTLGQLSIEGEAPCTSPCSLALRLLAC